MSVSYDKDILRIKAILLQKNIFNFGHNQTVRLKHLRKDNIYKVNSTVSDPKFSQMITSAWFKKKQSAWALRVRHVQRRAMRLPNFHFEKLLAEWVNLAEALWHLFCYYSKHTWSVAFNGPLISPGPAPWCVAQREERSLMPQWALGPQSQTSNLKLRENDICPEVRAPCLDSTCLKLKVVHPLLSCLFVSTLANCDTLFEMQPRWESMR